MALDDWDGMERFLNDTKGNWLHFASSSTPSYIEEHQENLKELESQRDAYLLAYGLEAENLVDPGVKYDRKGLLE